MLSFLRKILFSRISLCVIGIIIQLSYLAVLFWTLGTMFSYSYVGFWVIGFLVSLYIMNEDINPSYKIIWVFVVLCFPIFGCMFYWFYGHRHKKNSVLITDRYKVFYTEDSKNAEYLMQKSEAAYKQALYLRKSANFPMYSDTESEYFPNGESVFPTLLSELEKAENFIFIEYFIIEDGVMWNSILEILRRKANCGADVRVIYDDMGCLLTLPRDYYAALEKQGIKCCCFGRLKPLWSSKMNNRDHRKMLVIDGKIAFTGGINLADEYINKHEKHGYWKDSALMLKGSGVKSFTIMFLALWDYIKGEESNISHYISDFPAASAGLVIPFMDSPADNEPIAKNVYLNMINNAGRYVYITTPYLILDNELQSQLVLAAKNGIDVRIITPHIPDKKFVYEVTKANYNHLVNNGVRVFEFLPGFIHAKNIVSDDRLAVIGTINLDFRSLYLHYECGVWLYDTPSVADVKTDFMNTLTQCKEITMQDCVQRNIFKRVACAILRLFSPMM